MKHYGAGRSGNAGFSLVELMVAMAVGLVVLLGAGQLFTVISGQFRDVQQLTMQQSTIQVAADVLTRDIRRAGSVRLHNDCGDEDTLLCLDGLSNRQGVEGCQNNPGDINRQYKLSSDPRRDEGYELMQRQQCPDKPSFGLWQPVVAGFAKDGLGIDAVHTDTEGGIISVRVSLCLIKQDGEVTPCGSYEGDSRWLRFHVVNRTAAVTIQIP